MNLPGFKRKNGIMSIVVMFVIFFLAVLGWSLYNFMRFEQNLVARMQYASIADKMAQTAALEAASWFNCQVLNIRGLLSKDESELTDGESIILAPVRKKDIEGCSSYLAPSELKSFDLISGWGGTLKHVEIKYTGFKNYFNNVSATDFENNCSLPADPFERIGGLVITSKVTYRTITRVFCCRYEIKITNTLVPVISKFTFFTKNKAPGAIENQLLMEGEEKPALRHLGPQGIVDIAPASKPKIMPLIMIHHPDDVYESKGYASNHSKMREFLPLDESVAAGSSGSLSQSYRPSMSDRGWVYLGAEPTESYIMNVSPGNANPDLVEPYPSDQSHRFLGNGFLMLESDLYALVDTSLKGKYPFPHSFTDIEKPDGIADYIVRVVHTGMYWIGISTKEPKKKYLYGNYYKLRPTLADESSLLQLSGDIQPVSFLSKTKPDKYIDRRSPTIIFGKVFRSYLQVGTFMQNCFHPPGTSGEVFMNGPLHKVPFELCPASPHPKVTFIPYFEFDPSSGALGENKHMKLIHSTWFGVRKINDSHGTTAVGIGFSKAKYDLKENVFKLADAPDANHLATYNIFMSKVFVEPYNKSYNWIAANSTPAGGIVEPGDKYTLKKEKIPVLDSCSAQTDEQFFYGKGGAYKANNLSIFQFGKDKLKCTEAFPEGLFKGSLRSLKLYSDSYVNPMTAPPPSVAPVEYDIRQKASFIFDSYEDFSKHFLDFPAAKAGECHLKSGGVFYIDSDSTVDLTKGGAVSSFYFHQNAMIIFKKGVKVPKIFKGSYAANNNFTLSIVSIDGDITICGEMIEASLNAFNGSILKAVDYFQVYGNLTMKEIDFDISKPGNLFKVGNISALRKPILSTLHSSGTAIEGFNRISVTYDPGLDPCDHINYLSHYKYYIASRQTYWKTTNE